MYFWLSHISTSCRIQMPLLFVAPVWFVCSQRWGVCWRLCRQDFFEKELPKHTSLDCSRWRLYEMMSFFAIKVVCSLRLRIGLANCQLGCWCALRLCEMQRTPLEDPDSTSSQDRWYRFDSEIGSNWQQVMASGFSMLSLVARRTRMAMGYSTVRPTSVCVGYMG